MAAVTATAPSSEPFGSWLHNVHWASQTLTFSFPVSAASYSYAVTGFAPLDATQQAAVRKAMAEIESFTNLTITEVSDYSWSHGVLRFAKDVTDGGAYAYLPSTGDFGGDGFFGAPASNPDTGNEANVYFLHEIGHAFGLLHGHEMAEFLRSSLDSQEYTLMTYSDYAGDTSTYAFEGGPVDWAQSYQQLDIAALQHLYGANYAFSGEIWSGNTVYTFDPNSGEMSINGTGLGAPAGNRIFRTIWDGHGEDTYDLSNYATDLEIDLRPGAFSTFDPAQLADLDRFSSDPSRIAAGNVANARLYQGDTRSLIENAIGGVGDDMLVGNSANNSLTGNSGRDTLQGLDGDDLLIGKLMSDVLEGGAGADRVYGGPGWDVLVGAGQDDRLYGGIGRDRLYGGGGNDVLIGGTHDDGLFGGAGNDWITGSEGADRLVGSTGRDRFIYSSLDHSSGPGGYDRIDDFRSGEDWIHLAGLNLSGLQINLGGSFTGGGTASLITRQDGADLWVELDADGDLNSDFAVRLIGVGQIGADDFIL